jgi:hypothetical protein
MDWRFQRELPVSSKINRSISEVTIMTFRRSTWQVLLMLCTAALLLAACNVGAAPSPTPDVNALNTAIVGTTVAQLSGQFTQTALAAPTNTLPPANTVATLPTLSLATQDTGAATPTVNVAALPTFSFLNTPVPGATSNTPVVLPTSAQKATAALGDACNNNVFEGDVTIPDGSVIKPGADFQKVWAVRNTGSCTWDEGYTLVYIGGSDPNLDPYNFQFKKSSDFVPGGTSVNLGVNLTAPCTPGKYEGHWKMRDDKGYYFGTILSVYVEVKEKCP